MQLLEYIAMTINPCGIITAEVFMERGHAWAPEAGIEGNGGSRRARLLLVEAAVHKRVGEGLIH